MSSRSFSATIIRSTAVVGALTLAAAGCGGSDAATDTTAPLDSAVDSILDGSSIPASLPTVTEPGVTSNTTAAPAAGGTATIEGATLWSDGTSSLEVSPEWTEMAAGGTSAAWSLNYPDAPEANVNVASSPIGDFSTQAYIDASKGSLEAMGDISIVDSGVRSGPNGTEVGFIESKGEMASNPGIQLHFFATLNIKDGKATVATFTCEDAHYAAIIEDVLPYLETVKTA